MTTATPVRAASTAVLDESIARVRQLDASAILGSLCWYSIHTNMVVSHDEIANSLTRAGLDPRTVPAKPKDHDVFRRVTTDAQEKRVPIPGQDGIFENIMLRPVTETGEDHIVRRVVVETVDGKGRRLSYEQLCDIEFDRATSTISRKRLAEWRPVGDRIFDKVRADFNSQRGMLTSWAVREYVRSALTRRGATCVRSGGAVFFIRQEYSKDLDSLETFVNTLPSRVGEFHSLPLIDDTKRREMVQRAFEAETVEAIDKVMIELKRIRTSGEKITTERYAKLMLQRKELQAKTTEYSDLLAVKLAETEDRLDLFRKDVKLMMDYVKD